MIAEEATLPRRNGELVFDAPWASRAFGLAVALHEAGVVEWQEFRDRAIEEVGPRSAEDSLGYYERWYEALERLLVEHGVVTRDEIAVRADSIAHARTHDHDH